MKRSSASPVVVQCSECQRVRAERDALRAEVERMQADVIRLDFLEQLQGDGTLLNDDNGMWIVANGGCQDIREPGQWFESTAMVEPDEVWYETARAAIDAAMADAAEEE